MYCSDKIVLMAASSASVLRATATRSRQMAMKMIGATATLTACFGFLGARLSNRGGRLLLNVVRNHLDLVIVGVDVEPAFCITCLQQESSTSMEQPRSKPDIARHQTRT
jgi:hypothetical protein